MTEPIRHDFIKIIAEIEAAGITTYKIALMCRRAYGTVKHWKKTGRVEHYDGEKLLLIHAEYCKALTIPSSEEGSAGV